MMIQDPLRFLKAAQAALDRAIAETDLDTLATDDARALVSELEMGINAIQSQYLPADPAADHTAWPFKESA